MFGKKLNSEVSVNDLDNFLKDFFEFWDWNPPKYFYPKIVYPKEIPWQALAVGSRNKGRYGEYYQNLEVLRIDYRKILSDNRLIAWNIGTDQYLKDWLKVKEKPLIWASVMDYAHEVLSCKYLLPGIELQRYLLANIDQVPSNLMDGGWYFFPGASFCLSDGRWHVPYSYCGVVDGWKPNSYALNSKFNLRFNLSILLIK